MIKIGVFGLGYVGLITAIGFSQIGFDVYCYDINKEKIKYLKNGIIPFYEEDLEEKLKESIEKNKIFFCENSKEVIENSDTIFIAVGTPPDKDGKADLKYLQDSVYEIIKYINNSKTIVIKSTVPPGTSKKVESFIKENLDKSIHFNKNLNLNELHIDVVSNPEFLREGKAFYDFMNPDRIIIGVNNERSKTKMKNLYEYFINNGFKVFFTDRESSEIIKYGSNAFLALKISFINELAILAEKLDANIIDISYGIGLDNRIGNKFLNAGPGYGGSCLPKDTKALYSFAKELGINLKILEATILANENQIKYSINKIIKSMNYVNNRTITVLGLTFKPNTDDIRESIGIKIIKNLLQNGAIIKTYCPKGINKAKEELSNDTNLFFYENVYESLKDSEAIIITTEWDEFKKLDFEFIYSIMRDYYFFDLRNMFSDNYKIKSIFYYYGIGIPNSKMRDFIF